MTSLDSIRVGRWCRREMHAWFWWGNVKETKNLVKKIADGRTM